MKKFRITIAIIFVFNFLLISKINSQNFNYSVLVQNASFVFLNDSIKTINDNNILWDDNSYQMPIGFSFTFAGQSFDSIRIQTNGTLTFDRDNKFNFVSLFKNFMSELDSLNHSSSPITKQLTILSDGSKRLTVEFQNAAFVSLSGVRVHANFQIWLNQQNNSIEFHMGGVDVPLTDENCIVGLLNTNGGDSLGYLLQGNPTSPSGQFIPIGENITQLTTIPPDGSVYIFTKN